MDLDAGPRAGESLIRSLLPASSQIAAVGTGRMKRLDKYLRGRATWLQDGLGSGEEWGGGVLGDLRFLAWGTGQMMEADRKVDEESHIYGAPPVYQALGASHIILFNSHSNL